MIITKRGQITCWKRKAITWITHRTAETIRLGKLWRSKAGDDYRYVMVFETKEVAGANTLADRVNTIKI